MEQDTGILEELLKDEEGFVKSEALRSYSEIIGSVITAEQIPGIQELYESKHEECL